MNKTIGYFLVGVPLFLGSCGTEAQPAEESMDAVEQEMEEGPDVEAQAGEKNGAADAPEARSGEASPLLAKGEKTSFAFNKAGEFPIHCEPHPDMQMTVIVEEGADISGEGAVEIAGFAFAEKSLTIAPGTVITWTNQDDVKHNVAFD
ncbi:copper binding plastocyanin/azurin family protein [Planomicrobium soli]|uniref:Copper binding plastocyanin/azurin family protein n=1 Tax=Planomicrobium soli TaxID=1176648 RepID=A0A2P8H4K1_9BACL|nr:plastocyanin/azurin family copper-binding protein [Planomicrobium soli]PSL41123.1 copper binding plastocyanin/azurin family protein [Planomicrobium soli]